LLFLLAVISYAAGLARELRLRGRAQPAEEQAGPEEERAGPAWEQAGPAEYEAGAYEADDPPWREPRPTEVAHEDNGPG
jgi:hypothetical protein